MALFESPYRLEKKAKLSNDPSFKMLERRGEVAGSEPARPSRA